MSFGRGRPPCPVSAQASPSFLDLRKKLPPSGRAHLLRRAASVDPIAVCGDHARHPMPWITTTIMLERLHEAQDSAWEELASHFRAPVQAFALRLGLSHAAAEDVVQSTMLAFLRAYRDGRYDKRRGRLSSWLFGIAYREALRSIRDGARERQAPGAAGRTTFFSGQPDDDLAQRTWADEWDRHVLDRCMEQARAEVEPRTFEAFELAAIRSVPAGQVGAELGMSPNAVFVAKHRVLKRIAQLRREYEPEGAPA